MVARWSRSTYTTSGPVSTGMGDRSRVCVAFAPSICNEMDEDDDRKVSDISINDF